MPIEKGLSNLIINKVESKEVYNYMVANNLVNEDEMYLVQGDDEAQIIVDSALNTTSENPVQNKVVATSINNLNTLVGDTPVNTAVENALTEAKNSGELQADYAENDKRQVAFIKNRPCYDGEQTMGMQSTFSMNLASGYVKAGRYYVIESLKGVTFVDNKTYVIEKYSYAGTPITRYIKQTYSPGVQQLETLKILGNASIINNDEFLTLMFPYRGEETIDDLPDTGESFALINIEYQNDSSRLWLVSATSNEICIDNTDIIVTYYELKQLDEKYIPDTIQRVADMPTDYVTYTTQTLTEDQKKQVRTNIGAISSDEVTGVGTDVVKGSYKLRIGQEKYAGYGFAILYSGLVQMNYTNMGIYDEDSGSHLNMSRQSVFRASKGSQKKIVIQTEADSSSEEPKIVLFNKNGEYISISADGTLYYSGNILRVGSGPGYRNIVRYVNTPEEEYDAATKGYVDGKISDTEILLQSSTPDSTKKFRITVDDSGALTATEVTE